MGKYKYKLKEAPEDNLPKINKNDKFKVGYTTINNDTKSTITAIDPETGKISWGLEKLPNLEELFETSTELTQVAKDVYIKTKSDKKLRLIYDEARALRNSIRTHMRNEYPEEYRRVTMNMNEDNTLKESLNPEVSRKVNSFIKAMAKRYDYSEQDAIFAVIAALKQRMMDGLDEMSTTGGGAGSATFTPGTGGQYATPFAFRKKGQKANDKAYKELGYKAVKELTDSKNKKLKVISKELKAASKTHKGQAKKIDKIVKEKYGDGADLGPGPRASEDGVKDNAYVKQFAYKLVPKKIKGSGMIVKQLFEKEEGEKKNFQLKRIEAFDGIEKKLNDIYTTISNAKNKTIEYYKENPDSYKVVKPTDLVMDYLEDIKKLLK
tara:strand:+ start:1972 stop:3108 length:1137 start_codon:yes stop_codon:yes gene_type:complete